MGERIKLGNSRNPQNHIKVNDRSVGFNHLELEWTDDGILLIYDLNSTNFTKVNGVKVRQSRISPNDKIEVGDTIFTGQELMDVTARYRFKNKIRFFKEFDALGQHFISYEEKKKKAISGYKNKVSFIRFGFPVILLVLFLGFGEQLGIPKDARLLISLAGGGIAAVLADKLVSKENLNNNLHKLEMEYNTILACPKCATSLIKKSYLHWKNQRKCKSCEANWIA